MLAGFTFPPEEAVKFEQWTAGGDTCEMSYVAPPKKFNASWSSEASSLTDYYITDSGRHTLFSMSYDVYYKNVRLASRNFSVPVPFNVGDHTQNRCSNFPISNPFLVCFACRCNTLRYECVLVVWFCRYFEQGFLEVEHTAVNQVGVDMMFDCLPCVLLRRKSLLIFRSRIAHASKRN